MPAAVAAGLPETTTPWLPAATLGPRWATGALVACGQAKGVTNEIKRRETDDIEMILRIRGHLRKKPRVTSKTHVRTAALGCPAARLYRAAAAPHYSPVILSGAADWRREPSAQSTDPYHS